MTRSVPIALLVLALNAPALAQSEGWRGRDRAEAAVASVVQHGGKVARSEAHRFEVVYGPDTIRIYVYDAQGRPVSARGIRGRANMLVIRGIDGAARRRVNHQTTGADLRYQSASAKQGRLRDCLVAKHSIGEQEVQGVRVDVELGNVADEPAGEVAFRVEFVAWSRESEWACAAEGCSKRIYVDPGECPKCGATLRSRERAEQAREGAQPVPSAQPADEEGEDAEERPRPRRPWRR